MSCHNSGKKPTPITQPNQHASFWVEMIQDLVFGAGFSYSRIAYRMKVSPSTIQKLATDLNRKPRHHVFHALLGLHTKVFNEANAKPQTLAYWRSKQEKKSTDASQIKLS